MLGMRGVQNTEYFCVLGRWRWRGGGNKRPIKTEGAWFADHFQGGNTNVVALVHWSSITYVYNHVGHMYVCTSRDVWSV